MLSGAPIWQDLIWYLDWGSGIGGYVAHFSPVFGERELGGSAPLKGWKTNKWAVELVGLINHGDTPSDFYNFDPTSRLVPKPSPIHPVDEARRDY